MARTVANALLFFSGTSTRGGREPVRRTVGVCDGAEIYIDGAPTGEISPARVQIPTGAHIIALKLKGYQIAKRGVETSEGGTVNITEILHK